jgi:hypothetical protein
VGRDELRLPLPELSIVLTHRQGVDPLDVRGPGQCLAMMCLGDLSLKIYPKSRYPGATPDMVFKMDDEPEQAIGGETVIDSEPLASAPEDKALANAKSPRKRQKLHSAEAREDKGVDPPAPQKPARVATRGGSRKLPPPFVVKMVHGDILFLSGDDFHVRSFVSLSRAGINFASVFYCTHRNEYAYVSFPFYFRRLTEFLVLVAYGWSSP